MEKEVKRENNLSNEAFKERFQFLLSIIDNNKPEDIRENVICQRYFRINGFNSDSLCSVELQNVLTSCVDMIKDDLKYKSFLYQCVTNPGPIKMNGFAKNVEELSAEDILLMTCPDVRGEVTLSNGDTYVKEYVDCEAKEEDMYIDNELLNPWDVAFKFEFLVDDKPVFQKIWDGTVYPKQVRNSVDLSNTGSNYFDADRLSLNSIEGLMSYLKIGRVDLVNAMIKKIVEIASGRFDDKNAYTKKVQYDDKSYWLSMYLHNYQQIKSYQKWVQPKTRKYEEMLRKSEANAKTGGLSPSEWNYIEKYL